MSTVAADIDPDKSAPGTALPSERIAAANRAFRHGVTPADLPFLDRQYLRGDQASMALSYMLGALEVLARYPSRLTPEELAFAVEAAVEHALAYDRAAIAENPEFAHLNLPNEVSS